MQPDIVQVKHPGIDPQGMHTELFRNRPALHRQEFPTKEKSEAMLQTVQTAREVQRTHPTGQGKQRTAELR